MTGRTVHDRLADGPLDLGGQSEISTQTTSTVPRNMDVPWSPRRQFGKLTPTENTQLDRSKQSNARTRGDHDEQPASRHLADSPPTRADGPLRAETTART
jgi:hypothetical protein